MRILYTSFSLQIAVFALALLSFGTASAQSGWNPESYYGVPDRDKQVAFMDEFEDNRKRWDLGSPYLKERIDDGDFYCASLTSHTYTKHRTVSYNLKGNFEVEVRLRYVKGADESMTGLTFGRNERGSEFDFFFTPRKRFHVSRYDRGRSVELVKWQNSKFLNRFSYNTLTVRQVSGQWYFFVNRELVAQMEAQPLFGKAVGFTVGGHMAVEVDYLRVSDIKTVDNNGPQISLMEPSVSNQGAVHFSKAQQVIRGKVYDVSGVSAVTINGKALTVSSDGAFAASLRLREGANKIEVVASDRFGNQSRQRFEMIYEKPFEPVYTYQNRPKKQNDNQYTGNLNNFSQMNSGRGDNYILLIGINGYNNWNKLHNAVKDCEDIAKTLVDFYDFDREHVITLYNGEATRENILETLESLQETLTDEDNLLIYYAGHGFYDDVSQLGYWVPVEARLNKIPDFIRNSTIHDYLRTIETKHTLLIADACYAGSLFSAHRGVLNQNARSRWAFTSGDIEKVWDGQPGENSPFARYLIRYLRSSIKPELPANELIDAVGALVQRNTAQTPQGSPLRRAGDDGGVFIFHRR